MSDAAGHFDGANWVVFPSDDIEVVSLHERLHRQFNDTTSYGAMLDAIARLCGSEADPLPFKKLLRRLVSEARVTHEVCATYFSTYHQITAEQVVPICLLNNAEYLDYFRIAAHFVGLAPNMAKGCLILWAVLRIAMDGPLPEAVRNANFKELRGSDFRAVDSPDQRLFKLREILTPAVCDAALEATRAVYGRFPEWQTYVERPDFSHVTDDFIHLKSVGDYALIEPGGISPQLETAFGNGVLDYIAEYMTQHGMSMYTLIERTAMEARIRAAIDIPSDRLYDDPHNGSEFQHRRILGRETLQFKTEPVSTYIRSPLSVAQSDWAIFRRMREEEGECPIYIRTADDFLRNHKVLENPEQIPLERGVIVCFLRKRRRLANGEIVFDVVMMRTPRDVLGMRIYIGSLRACISGRLLTLGWRSRSAPWMAQLQHGPRNILIDTHPQQIVNGLGNMGEMLIWHMLAVGGQSDMQVLVLYPIGAGTTPNLTLFRPGTWDTSDAVLKAISFPHLHHSQFQYYDQLSDAARHREWPLPEHVHWTLSRFLAEEAVFKPLTPEEMQRDAK
jgi:hypothetical protein